MHFRILEIYPNRFIIAIGQIVNGPLAEKARARAKNRWKGLWYDYPFPQG